MRITDMLKNWTGVAMLVSSSVAAACAGDARPEREDESPRLSVGTVQLSIGSMEGADAYVFGRVTGLALDDAGRILVVDGQADQVRVFSPAGEFQFALGRSGAGPGELSGPCCLAFDAQDRLWVRDGGNARYDVFRLGENGGEFVRSVRMAHGDVNRWAPVTFDSEGRVIDIGFRPDPTSARPRTARMHLDSSGTVMATVAVHQAPPESLSVHVATRQSPTGSSTRFIYQPYGAVDLVAHSPEGGYVYALNTRYAITWFDEEGEMVGETRGRIAQGPALTEEERAQSQEQLESQAKWVGATAASLPFGVPENKPVLQRLFFDTDGRLWVQLHAPAGAPRQADVYDAEGTYLCRAEWPAGIDLSHDAIRGGSALGVATDSLDVQRVVLLRFTGPLAESE